MDEDPLVWNDFDQKEELARLQDWLAKVETRLGRQRLCHALVELMQRDLLRYGLCGGAAGFGVIGEWAALEAWACGIFYPSDPVSYGIIRGLVSPRMMLVETGYSKQEPDLKFVSLLWDAGGSGGTHPAPVGEVAAPGRVTPPRRCPVVQRRKR